MPETPPAPAGSTSDAAASVGLTEPDSRFRSWIHTPSLPWDIFGLLARVLVAVVWIVAGYLKALDANQMILSVRAYQLLPESLVWPVAAVLPYLEIAAGVLLLLGLATRLASALSILLFVAFLIGIISAAARGLSIDCGCFGSGGPTDDPAYTSEILRDFGLLFLSILLFIRPRTLWAVDGLGRRGREDIEDESGDGADDGARDDARNDETAADQAD